MPRQDANLATDTSDVADMDDAIAKGIAQTDATADSSAATDENTEKDLLSVARDVVARRETKADGTVAASSAEEDAKDGEDAGAAQDASAEDKFDDVPFHAHPRFKQIVTQRNMAREKAVALEPDATRFRQIREFVDSQGLTDEETADGLVIMGLMKTNPVEAWKRLRPTVETLLRATGEILPADLEAEVREGRMTRDVALTVSRTNAALRSQQAHQQFQAQRQEQVRVQEAQSALATAANDWQSERQKRDPNFAAKLVPIQKELAYLKTTGQLAATPEGIRQQLEAVYKTVNAGFKKPEVKPAPKVQARTPQTNGSVATVVAHDSTTMDAAQRVLARRGAAATH